MKKAFTLAEILITLGIIGIVSAMTLPTLQANITNKQFRTKFLKNYSQIQQVMKKMEADDIPLTATGNKNEPFYKNFRKYLSNTVDCGDSTVRVKDNNVIIRPATSDEIKTWRKTEGIGQSARKAANTVERVKQIKWINVSISMGGKFINFLKP